MTERQVLSIVRVEISLTGIGATNFGNVLKYNQKFPQKIVPRFTPNTTPAVGVTYHSGKHRVIEVTFDGVRSEFETFWDDSGKNPKLDFAAVFRVAGDANTYQTHTFEDGTTRLSSRGDLSVHETEVRSPITLIFKCIGDRVVTHS